ncbi:Nucleotide-binding, alpha-beta plait [Artemisia annua]|uniref:Nucleotide-binding, alpha-beta plait n=1 Tax=Artemisia annua TaxID=35608 RepID=A0A2U1NN16_ARTAN|nr:Nucleotide-binding, alpha-beta plait [Artemisia annua]
MISDPENCGAPSCTGNNDYSGDIFIQLDNCQCFFFSNASPPTVAGSLGFETSSLTKRVLQLQQNTISCCLNDAPGMNATSFTACLCRVVIPCNSILFHSTWLTEWVTIRSNKFGQPKGYAYVEFVEPEAVQKALLLNESELHGRQLKKKKKRFPETKNASCWNRTKEDAGINGCR